MDSVLFFIKIASVGISLVLVLQRIQRKRSSFFNVINMEGKQKLFTCFSYNRLHGKHAIPHFIEFRINSCEKIVAMKTPSIYAINILYMNIF